MAIYTFQTTLLSAQKTGNPPLIGTSLSGVGFSFLSGNSVTFLTQNVGIVSLSTLDAGVTFAPASITIAPTSLSTFNVSAYPMKTVNIAGSVINIPSGLHNSNVALVKTTPGLFTVVPFLSTVTTVPTSAFSTEFGVSTSETRRKRHLGY